MSEILIKVKKRDLVHDDINEEDFLKLKIEFIVGLKSIFSDFISENYDISYKNAMNIVRIEEYDSEYRIGIKSPELYNGKTRRTVVNILKYDLGSIAEKIQPLYLIRDASSELTNSVYVLWNNFIKDRTRGENLNE